MHARLPDVCPPPLSARVHLNQEEELVNTDLQKAAGIVLLNHFQAVLHEARGLAQLHGAVRDLVPNHLRLVKKQRGRCKMAEDSRGAPWDFGKLPQSRIHEHPGSGSKWIRILCVTPHGQWLWRTAGRVFIETANNRTLRERLWKAEY